MAAPLVSIGLERNIVEAIGQEVGHIVVHDALPRAFSQGGQAFVESPTIWGKYLRPRGVMYYCHFENPRVVRRALALADTPTFPNIRKTLPHDDKALSLVAAIEADPGPSVPRGFVPGDQEIPIPKGETVVGKWGEWHCGEGKECFQDVAKTPEPAVLEPFIGGESHRILIVGERAWQLHYESDDWRKNVGATITQVEPEASLVARARKTAENLGLVVAGIDYIVNGDSAALLEVNAYPGLDQVHEAEQEFIGLAVKWARKLEG